MACNNILASQWSRVVVIDDVHWL